MDRLTERTQLGSLIQKRNVSTRQIIDKLGQFEDAEEQGRLLSLPIDEDTPVYSIEYCCGENTNNKMGMCVRGFCKDCDKKAYYIKEGTAKQCILSEIGRSVFFTHEQAEQAISNISAGGIS